MPGALELDELETPRLLYAVLTGHWLDEDGSFELDLDPVRTDNRQVGLRLSVRGTAAPATAYRAVTAEPDDVPYDPAVPPRIELMKIRTGHVFVRPKIDGRDVGWFAFDTGTGAGLTLLDAIAEELGMPRLGRRAGGGAGSAIQIASLRQGRSFELGPVTIANSVYVELPDQLRVTMRRLADIEVVGTCGYDLSAGSVETMLGKVAWIDIAGERRSDVPALFVTGASGALADPHTHGTIGGILLAPRKLLFDYGRRRMAVIDVNGSRGS